jgi:uncharacterized protein YndB with AHSA1/START domain
MASQTDRIEKQTVVRAPLAKVWSSLSDPAEFGAWFGLKVEGSFTPGAKVKGTLTNPTYAHLTFEIVIAEVLPRKLFSYRWHPYAIDPKSDYSKEPMTRIEFRLEEVKEGTRVTLVESGFDQIPAARRAEAFRMNDGGWTQQIENLARHAAAK